MPCRAPATSQTQEDMEQTSDSDLQKRSSPESLGLFYDKDFRLKEFIGNGFFSAVYKVTLDDSRTFALKVNLKQENRANCLREIQLLKKLNHPNILGYRGVYFDEGNFHPLIEFINGGTLDELVASSKGREIELELKWLVIDNTSKGLEYLHEMNIFHRDLASKNILLETEESGRVTRAIVGDFGLADYLPQVKGQQQLAAVGSPFWMAPECLMANGDFYYDHKVDVFSYGIVLCELMAQVDADPDILPRRNDFGIDWERFMPLLNRYMCPVGIIDVISRCTDMNPALRPDFCEIVSDMKEHRKTYSAAITNGANSPLTPDDGSDNNLPTRVSNPFRSNSVSLPFKEGDVRYKLIDQPDESEIYAAMDPEMSEAVKHAFAKWHDDISLGSSNHSKARSGTMPDVSSMHKSGHHSLPCRLREQDFRVKKLTFPPSLLGDISSSPHLADENCCGDSELGDEDNLSETLDNTRSTMGGALERRRRSGVDDINRYSKNTQVNRHLSNSAENRYSKLSSGDSGLSSLVAVSGGSSSILLSPFEDKLTSLTILETAEKLRSNSSIPNLNSSNHSNKENSPDEENNRKSLCSQVDEMFNFLSVSDVEVDDMENQRSSKNLGGLQIETLDGDKKQFSPDNYKSAATLQHGINQVPDDSLSCGKIGIMARDAVNKHDDTVNNDSSERPLTQQICPQCTCSVS